jgi:mannan endo-1,4-beta-mannosidase
MKISIICLVLIPIAFGFLSVENNNLVFNNHTVFLSGANNAWVHYGRDFGSGAYNSSRVQFGKWLTEVSIAGGNAVRVWVHIDGQWSPKFDAQGFATGEDVKSLIEELGEYLDFAEELNIFVIFCLWNGAVKPQQMLHLYADEAKLNSYLEKVLKPLVTGLKNKKSLGAWEIVNEVEGSVKQNISDLNPCFDTKKLLYSGANWAKSDLTMKQALNFINKHIDAIKTADPKVLVTSGSWNERSNLDVCNYCFNYYKDECLEAAGGKPKGVLGIDLKTNSLFKD